MAVYSARSPSSTCRATLSAFFSTARPSLVSLLTMTFWWSSEGSRSIQPRFSRFASTVDIVCGVTMLSLASCAADIPSG